MRHAKLLKRMLYIAGAFVVVYYFRHAIISGIVDTEVVGRKYVGLVVDGGETNAFSYYLFKPPNFELADESTEPWRECKRLNARLEGYLSNYLEGWQPSDTGYMFVSESYSSGYKAYIRFDNRVIFVWRFPDFGGSSPTEQEKKVCATADR